MAKPRIAVRVPEQLGRDFAEIAARSGRTKTAVLIEALEDFLHKKFEGADLLDLNERSVPSDKP